MVMVWEVLGVVASGYHGGGGDGLKGARER